MTPDPLPSFPYGAVYFRRSNPPESDWARDYVTAAADGYTVFRHWFLWSAIEIRPGVYDWSAYDRHLDLAAEQGIKTIIAEMVAVAPEWAYRRYAHARYETRTGQRLGPAMHGSCVVGGAPGLCLDNLDLRKAAERFLRALVMRYRDHPGLGGYDIWNEGNYPGAVCYCPATVADFRNWAERRYGDLHSLGEAWRRYSFESWEDVNPPRTLGPYPDCLDWLAFRIENAFEQLDWRADTIRTLDPEHPITAHGIAGTLTGMASNTRDDWRAADRVAIYGYTWGSSRHGDEPWKQVHAVDLVRSASQSKPFWHAEAYGGPLWLQPNVLDKPRDAGRIAEPEDIRYWDLVSFMCGATGLLYLRWRPLLDGPLFGAFGPYGLDGSRTDRSAMAARIAQWVAAPPQAALWRSRPVRGEVGIVVVPETQRFLYALLGSTDVYAQALQGIYRGFFDLNVQADWVRIDAPWAATLDAYQVFYLPVPVALTAATADRLRDWVEAGGTLIVEGCPGYFDEYGHVGTQQPGMGLADLFGVRERYVEFTPDLLDELQLDVHGTRAWGGFLLQAYEPTTGEIQGRYVDVAGRADGQVAVVDHAHGDGRTRLIGTLVGYGHATHAKQTRGAEGGTVDPGGNGAFFRDLIAWAEITPHVRVSDPRLIARLHVGDGGTYLWVANPMRRDRLARVTLAEGWGPFSEAQVLWGGEGTLDGQTLTLMAPARDVTVLALR